MTKLEERRLDDGLAAAPVFEDNGETVRLLGSVCEVCSRVAFPRRVVCLWCGGEQSSYVLSGAGTLHSWTHLANPPFGFDSAIYYGCIDLDEGPRALCVLGGGPPRSGVRVQAVPADVKHGARGFCFEVADA